MINSKVFLIDFADSFTHNIAAELLSHGVHCQIVPYSNCMAIKAWSGKKAIIYGPGPGAPQDYPLATELIKSQENNNATFQLGICLGHQLIWASRGMSIRRSRQPVHGMAISISIPSWRLFNKKDWNRRVMVQRYNSLIVDGKNLDDKRLYFFDGELQMGHDRNLLSYQFHPESVGTSYPEIFFKPLFDFLYNAKDG